MSIEVINTTINAAKSVIERTWRATQFTEDMSDYSCTIYRERKTQIAGLDPSYTRKRIDPVVGNPSEGTDGTDPSHYSNAKIGFVPEVTAKMSEILAYDPSETVSAKHPNPAINAIIGEVTVPACMVPLLLAEIYDLVATKANQDALNKAIQDKINKMQ